MTTLARRNRVVARASAPLEREIAAWLRRYGAVIVEREISRRGARVSKANPETTLMRELRDLLAKFGLRQASAAARSGAREAGGSLMIPGTLVSDAIAGREIPLKWFERYVAGVERRARDLAAETKRRVVRAVRQVIADAERETPTPSTGEIARRIRTTTLGTDRQGAVYVLSSERAAVVAQTEMTIATNTGTIEGYRATGVTEIEWLARRDGRSGDRHHERMHGQRRALGRSFVMPSGATLRYPGDPLGPVGEIVNCRCAVKPVLGGKSDG